MKTSKTPIIFCHFGFCSYLQYSLKQAKRSNPNCRIILLTDEAQPDIPDGIDVYDVYDYFKGAAEFAVHYEHMNTNPFHFELACFQRWFVIKDFCETQGIEKFFYCDSDVMLYVDIEEAEEHFENCAFTVTSNISWGITFNTTSILKFFCSVCNGIYSGRDRINNFKLQAHFQVLQENNLPGGVCDMTIVELFRKEPLTPPGLVGEMSAIVKEEITDTESCFVDWKYSTFDHNINQHEGYSMKDGIKEVTWKNGLPYCYNIFLDKEVLMCCLHFQGPAKLKMAEFSNE